MSKRRDPVARQLRHPRFKPQRVPNKRPDRHRDAVVEALAEIEDGDRAQKGEEPDG